MATKALSPTQAEWSQTWVGTLQFWEGRLFFKAFRQRRSMSVKCFSKTANHPFSSIAADGLRRTAISFPEMTPAPHPRPHQMPPGIFPPFIENSVHDAHT
ncbi:MAG: hypothetical protein R2874_13030 [Desulfobacterales bacterium]